MTTKITTIHDRMIAILSGEFTTKQELVNPYQIEENDDIILANSYGIAIDTATRSPELRERYIVFERDINLVLTEKTYGSERDVVSRKAVEKSLLEDQLTAISLFEQDSVLRNICDIDLIDDNGVEQTISDRSNFWMNRSRFQVKYEEIINTK